MANRLKYWETITKAEHYIRKHVQCRTDNVHQRVYIDTYRKRKHNGNTIMNSTHITYKKKYNMCYWIKFFFALRIKKFTFSTPAGEMRKQDAAGTQK